MSQINWDYEFSFVFSTEEYWNIFVMHLTAAIELFVPLVKRKSTRLSNRKTYPRILRNMLNHKALLGKKWRITNVSQDKLVYKEYCTKCRNALALYLRNKELDVISSGNVGKFYRYVNNKLGSRQTVQPLKVCTNNNELTNNSLEQANLCNKYFGSVFTVDNGCKPAVIHPRIFENICCDSATFNVENVRKALSTLKPSTSSGPDGIPNLLLKKLAHSVCNPLCYIFDSSFKSHCLPPWWLQAFVIPVFKKEPHLTHLTTDPYH